MDAWTLLPQFSDFRAVAVDIKVTLVVGKNRWPKHTKHEKRPIPSESEKWGANKRQQKHINNDIELPEFRSFPSLGALQHLLTHTQTDSAHFCGHVLPIPPQYISSDCIINTNASVLFGFPISNGSRESQGQFPGPEVNVT